MRTILPLLFVAMLATTAQGFAQRDDIENTLGLGPQLGWYSSNDAEGGALFFGLLGRARLGNNIGVEASVAYRTAEVFNTGSVDQNEITADVAYVPITFSLLIMAPIGSTITPYATGGIGFYYTIESYDLPNVSSENVRKLLKDEENFEMGYHFGLGLEIPFNRHIAAYAEFRYVFLGSEITSINDVVTLDTDTKNSDGMMFGAGVVFYL